jgi:hypothetical protein
VTYDHWKTTDPAAEQVLGTARLQLAADDAAVIAEEIECLGKLLDKFRESHGEALHERLAVLLPFEHYIDAATAKKVYAFARSLEPVED